MVYVLIVKALSRSRRFQPGEGSSLGLLRDCTTSPINRLQHYFKVFTCTFQRANHPEHEEGDGRVDLLEHPQQNVDVGLEDDRPDQDDDASNIILAVKHKTWIVSEYEGRPGNENLNYFEAFCYFNIAPTGL